MFEIETAEHRQHIARWHVQAWKHRLRGDVDQMKAVHWKIKESKKRIAECERMARQLQKAYAGLAATQRDWMFIPAYLALRLAEYCIGYFF